MTNWYYSHNGTRYPIDYKFQKNLTDGKDRYEHHVITITNIELIAESLEEIVSLVKEKIFGK